MDATLDTPLRGPAVRAAGLALPPAPMPSWHAGRPLKRWRYVGVFTPELMLCVGDARIGPVPQRWWAVALPDGTLRERTTFGARGMVLDCPWRDDPAGARGPSATGPGNGPTAPAEPTHIRAGSGGVRIDLELDELAGVETVSPVTARGAYAWTRKQACVPGRGTVSIDGVDHRIDSDAGFVDDSAGYHARHTAWRWSAGVGRTSDGRQVGWNLVAGIHDAAGASERTVWVDGESHEVGPVEFAGDLSAVAPPSGWGPAAGTRHGPAGADGPTAGSDHDPPQLAFEAWAERAHSTNALLLRSRYRQPFGTFSGTLGPGLELAEGLGVMEDHDVHW